MKKVFKVLLGILICNASAFAGTGFQIGGEGGGGGDELRNFYVDYPVISSLGVTVKAVCLEADGMTLNGGTAYTCRQKADRGATCIGKELVELKAPRVQMKELCTQYAPRNGGCLISKIVQFEIPLEYELNVFQILPRGIDFGNPISRVSYTIPACETQTGISTTR